MGSDQESKDRTIAGNGLTGWIILVSHRWFQRLAIRNTISSLLEQSEFSARIFTSNDEHPHKHPYICNSLISNVLVCSGRIGISKFFLLATRKNWTRKPDCNGARETRHEVREEHSTMK